MAATTTTDRFDVLDYSDGWFIVDTWNLCRRVSRAYKTEADARRALALRKA